MSETRTNESREVRRPELDRRWSPAVEAQVLDIVARTGSPKMAAEQIGISVATVHDHRRRDPEFGAKYSAAMDTAFHVILGRASERSLDEAEPSDRLIEVLLKFRWPEILKASWLLLRRAVQPHQRLPVSTLASLPGWRPPTAPC